MATDAWVRTYSSVSRLYVRILGLVWITLLFGVLVGGVVRAGGWATVLLGVLVLPFAGYGYYRLCRVMWRLTDSGIFHSAEGVKVARGRGVIIPWAEIAGFEGRPGVGEYGMFSTGYVLCVVRKDGTFVPTQLTGGKPLSPFGRRTYARAMRVLDTELRRHRDRMTDPA